MEPEVPVAAGQRVATLAIVIEPRRAGDEDLAPRPLGVVDALEQVPPSRVLVDFVEQDQGFPRRKLGLSQSRGNAGMIPVQIGGMCFIRVLAQKPERKRRLADLPWAADEHEFLLQGFSNGGFQISRDAHEMEYSPFYS